MTLELLRDFFLNCLWINLGVLIFWTIMFIVAKDIIYTTHTKWFKISRERFDEMLYMIIGMYKVGFILFVVAPYLALVMMS